ncbi:hypothetical protein GCM10010211_73420 [Streptomyces albospinus]|uniref:Uncharacterized protein n=1 Tax=Streptomyces albospinus TaxID=285515 RepID=A0ABQ2VNM3_9ACTN|nr:hypothetical protein GCM10010211_73420 [Streptomyces albospinus]
MRLAVDTMTINLSGRRGESLGPGGGARVLADVGFRDGVADDGGVVMDAMIGGAPGAGAGRGR